MADVMKLGLVLSAVDKMSRVINGASENASKKFGNIEKAMKGINSVSNKMFVAGGIAAAGIYKAVGAAEDGAASERKLANVFKSMWGDNGEANKAGKIASDYAEKLALQIGVEDDLIRTTQAKLATFSNVSNKVGMMTGIFDRATRAAYDMAAVGFGEASQNAVMLGKALQDPMKMATALKKQGTLTANDIISIQGIYETQGLLKAQEEVLKAVERQVKGTGLATVKATDIMKTGFGQVTEAIGGAFLPSVDSARDKMASVFQPTIDWINNNHKLIQTIAKIGIGLLATAIALRALTTVMSVARGIAISYNIILGVHAAIIGKMPLAMGKNIIALKAYAFAQNIASVAQWVFNASLYGCPIVWIIAGIAALGAGIYLLVKHWDVVTASMKKFGAYLLSGVLKPIIWVLEAIGKLTGAKWAINMAANLNKFKSKMDVTASSPIRSKAVGVISSVNNSRMSNANSNQSQVTYAPVFHLSGGESAKAEITSLLGHDKRSLEQMLTDMSNRNKRLSYAR